MSLLPTHADGPSPFTAGARRQQRRPSRSLPLILRRLLRFPQMDFEFASWQMAYLIIAPRRVYRNIYYHKQTKNQWARDDPAFLVLLACLLCISALAWGLAYGLGIMGIVRAMLFMVIVDFLCIGSLVATFSWFVTNRFLTHNQMAHAVEQKVEWAYAFDVHCNSFFPVFLILYVVQFFFISLLKRSNWISLFVGNTMYFVSAVWYIYGTFLGYNALPFLIHTELFLYPIIICIILYAVSLFGFNVSQHVLALYFGN
ncbi:UNC-50 [Radiomyces spectabilis]|uniref:UNC-50 n=1 Tax=Radiomyces spectabilis TaxID=64574 RepID=UPI00222005D1|nr:UNC-50 [Radiomyces spectabilis]KAI8391565.1 UNC-50 [Radiomyces spectabilis]